MGIQSQPQTEETSPEVSSPSSTTANSQTQTNETSPEVSPPSPTTRNTTKLRAQEISRLYSNENLPWNIYLLLLVNRENAQQSYAALRDLGDKKIPKWYLQQRNAYIQAIAVTGSLLAAVVVTSFSLPRIDSTPWTVSAFWYVALHASIISVYLCITAIGTMESQLRRVSKEFERGLNRKLGALWELEHPFIMVYISGSLYLVGCLIYILEPLGKGVYTGIQKEAALYLGLVAVLSFGVITPIMIFARSSSQPRKGDGPRGQRRGVGAVTEIV